MDGFGARLKQWRQALGLKQADFADLTGIHPVQIRKYETEAYPPSAEIIARIAEKTGVNLNWLMTGKGSMRSENKQTETLPEALPETLAQHKDQLLAIYGLLSEMDEDRAASTINELFARVQEAQRVNDLEKIVRELRDHQHKTGA